MVRIRQAPAGLAALSSKTLIIVGIPDAVDRKDDVCFMLDDLAGVLIMLKVYMDLGARRDISEPIMTVSATAFRPVDYKRFVRPWNRMLAGWGASAFHATDFYPGAAEFVRETADRRARFQRDCKAIPRMVADNVVRISTVAFLPNEVKRKAPAGWSEHFGDSLHSLAVQFAMISLGWWAKENKYFGGFAYFMESGDDDCAHVTETVREIRRDPQMSRHAQIRSFATIDKGTARGLEAADFVAWHWNKYFADKVLKGTPGNMRKDFAAFADIAEDKAQVAFLTGAKLDWFFELGQQGYSVSRPLPE